MYCTRPVVRSPSVFRIVKSPAARNASFFPLPFFPRGGAHDFAPLIRMLDDFTGTRPFEVPVFARQSPAFQPRFDVREVGETYELRGEIPGVESENLEVEFPDDQTLVVRGRAEREHSSGTVPPSTTATASALDGLTTEESKTVTNEAEAEAESDKDSDAASTYSTGSYQRPSVEDGDVPETSTSAQAKAQKQAVEKPAVEQQQQQIAEQAQPQSEGHYWISERSTGSFQRVFNFPHRVDQDAVKASLRNGILSIIVPKAVAPTAKKITVQ